MKEYNLLMLSLILATMSHAQDNTLPYAEIPPYPESYTAATVAARLIDGVGFRYYWATEGLREEDLKFKPGAEARTTLETIIHIYELSETIINTSNQTATITDRKKPVLTFIELRKKTLENLKAASDKFRSLPDAKMGDYNMSFKSATRSKDYPFWNQINGPISDALWHIGQVISFRRSSGNPFNSKVSVLEGKLMK